MIGLINLIILYQYYLKLFKKMAELKAVAEGTGSFDSGKLYVWVKGLESKVNTLLREIDLVKNDTMKKNGDLRREIKVLGEEVLELKRVQEMMRRMMDLMVQELKQTAGREEIQVLRKYVDFWNPMTFVTSRDVERVVEAKMGKSKAESLSAGLSARTIVEQKV